MKGTNLMKEIQLINFRSLKDTGLQALAPITILVGENSSGKSSFLRVFPLLKQSLKRRISGPILWAGDTDDYVDFGSFEETVTNDNSDRIGLKFKFDIMEPGMLFRGRKKVADSKTYEIEVEVRIASKESNDYVSNLIINVASSSFSFDLAKNSVLIDNEQFYNLGSTKEREESIDPLTAIRFRSFVEPDSVFGVTLPNINDVIDELYEEIFIDNETLKRARRNFDLISEVGKTLFEEKPLNAKGGINRKEDEESEYINLYNCFIEAIRDNPSRQRIVKLCYLYFIFPSIDNFIDTYFRNVHYIAPLRATAERYYRLRNFAIDEVDYQGKNLAIYINGLSSTQRRNFQSWTSEHFGFTVQTDKGNGHLSLLIQLNESEKKINLSDTGFGYSQVLPIITQLWELSTRKNKKQGFFYSRNPLVPLVVAIEQPELHLHPAVQAKLTKAFIACIELAREHGNELQLLLETHSETIVSYLGRAIARDKLTPEDVTVLLFEKDLDTNITDVRNSNYDSNGFLINWPYGFFESEE